MAHQGTIKTNRSNVASAAVIASTGDPAALRARLLAWYDASARTFPWRTPPLGQKPRVRADPYRVWLSEIMLQQTTTAAVRPYFEAFLARWPTVEALAGAADADVMAAWAGLGYYARARNLLRCARVVSADCGGVFPETVESLRMLPGVGPYTAAAMAAIAFDQPANVVDGNVERVIARLFAEPLPLPDAKPRLWALAAQLVAAERPGDWAQALMDLGATICAPRRPACGTCPLRPDCAGAATGEPASFPRRRPKAVRPQRYGAVFIVLRGSQVALERRPAAGLLGGMLGAPTGEWRLDPGAADVSSAPFAAPWRALGVVRHVFTHFALELAVFGVRDLPAATTDRLMFVALDAAMAGTPTVFRKVISAALAEGL